MKNYLNIGLISIFLALLFLSPIGKISSEFIDKFLFSFNSSGEIRLSISPLRIPDGASTNYCEIFTTTSGTKIQIFTVAQDGKRYCSEPNIDNGTDPLIPFKLKNDTTIFWLGTGVLVVDTSSNNPFRGSKNDKDVGAFQ